MKTLNGKERNDAKALLDKMCESPIAERRRENLLLLWRTLEEMEREGCRLISVTEVGNRFEKAGGLKLQSLRNAAGADYRKIIELFASERSSSRKFDAEPDPVKLALSRIPDASVRATLKAAMDEAATLRLSNARLQRAMKDFSLTAADLAAPAAARPSPLTSNESKVAITPRMVSVLSKALDPSRLEEKGLTILENGGIEDDRGSLIFPPGFADAIKAIVG